MMNQYYGAWNGPEEGLVKMLEHAGSSFPDKMFIISEFGTPGIFGTDTSGSIRRFVRAFDEAAARTPGREVIVVGIDSSSRIVTLTPKSR